MYKTICRHVHELVQYDWYKPMPISVLMPMFSKAAVSGRCSICKTPIYSCVDLSFTVWPRALPQHFLRPPPNLELVALHVIRYWVVGKRLLSPVRVRQEVPMIRVFVELPSHPLVLRRVAAPVAKVDIELLDASLTRTNALSEDPLHPMVHAPIVATDSALAQPHVDPVEREAKVVKVRAWTSSQCASSGGSPRHPRQS